MHRAGRMRSNVSVEAVIRASAEDDLRTELPELFERDDVAIIIIPDADFDNLIEVMPDGPDENS